MDWYKFDISAYRGKTRGLTPTEHGIYRLLMDECYITLSALPDDLKYLRLVCRCTTKRDSAALNLVLARYFPLNGDGLRHNARVDEEIADYKAMSDANRNAARIRHAMRTQPERNASAMPKRQTYKEEGETPVDNSNCQHVNNDGSKCGKIGVHKLHPRSSQWYCSEHQDG